jgi:hypothetical protein
MPCKTSGFPHGISSVYALVLGISSCLLALSSSWGCYFVNVDFVFLNNSPDEIDGLGGMAMGLLSYEDKTAGAGELKCVSYSITQMEEFDVFFKAARSCAITANVLFGISTVLLMFISCIAVRSSIITLLSAIVLAAGVFEALTFLMFFSSFSCSDCQFYFGSGLALLSTIIAMVNGAVVCHISEASASDDDFYDDDSDISDAQVFGKPGTPHAQVVIKSTSSESSDSFVVPNRLSVYDTEVVIVLPDGRKQVIVPRMSRPPKICCDADGSGDEITLPPREEDHTSKKLCCGVEICPGAP